jgi:quercetin dioxygenase-like cupin family protein
LSVSDRFEDHRGVIQDLLGPVDAVTEIVTLKGAVRGNHTHARTTQYTYVVYGLLEVVLRPSGSSVTHQAKYGPGILFCEAPGTAHAWKALTDTKVLVFTQGPRSGADYESDTQRLDIPLL